MKLLLSPSHLAYSRDEIGVVQDGVPIPYEWTGRLEITVDDIFERAAIQVTPKPLNGLPADVLAAAKFVYDDLITPGNDAADEFAPEDIAKIARAIQVERERCAKLVEAFKETTVDGRAELVDAIRNPK